SAAERVPGQARSSNVSARLHPLVLCGALLAAFLLVFVRAGEADAFAPPPEGWGAAYERAAGEYWGEDATRGDATTRDFDSSLPLTHRLEQGGGQVLGRATVAEGPDEQCQMWIAPLPHRSIYFRCV